MTTTRPDTMMMTTTPEEEQIRANIEEGLLFLNQSWSKLDVKCIDGIFKELEPDDEDNVQPGTSKPVTRLWLEGKLSEVPLALLLKLLVKHKTPITRLKIMDTTAPVWLLPTLLRLLPKLRMLVFRDPAYRQDDDDKSGRAQYSWSILQDALQRHKSLRILRLEWNDRPRVTQRVEGSSTGCTLDNWIEILPKLVGLTEFTQLGDHPCQLWSRKQVYELLKHRTLKTLRLATTLIGEWPDPNDRFIFPFPARHTPLTLSLSRLPQMDLVDLKKIVPVRSDIAWPKRKTLPDTTKTKSPNDTTRTHTFRIRHHRHLVQHYVCLKKEEPLLASTPPRVATHEDVEMTRPAASVSPVDVSTDFWHQPQQELDLRETDGDDSQGEEDFTDTDST